MANRLLEECEIILEEENFSVAPDGIKKAEILEIFKDAKIPEKATNVMKRFAEDDLDLKENFETLLKLMEVSKNVKSEEKTPVLALK